MERKKILIKSDKTPTYLLAVVVDDHDMNISHVIRGDDHISNTPHQNLLYDVLKWDKPHYIHIPQVLDADGKKLSKRTGAKSVGEYLDDGYLPVAITNHLLRLGWGKGDMELFTLNDAIKHFDLRGLRKSASRFDQKKLDYLNRYWSRF